MKKGGTMKRQKTNTPKGEPKITIESDSDTSTTSSDEENYGTIKRVDKPQETPVMQLLQPPPGKGGHRVNDKVYEKTDNNVTERAHSSVSVVSLSDTSTASPITPITPSALTDVASRIILDTVVEPALKQIGNELEGEELANIDKVRQMIYDTESTVPGFTKKFIDGMMALLKVEKMSSPKRIEPDVQEEIPVWQIRIDEDESKLRETPIASKLLKRWKTKCASDEASSSLFL
jgi:hypothetical protein